MGWTRRMALEAGLVGMGASLSGLARAASTDPSYAYEWPVPWLPDSDADIDVVQVPTAGITLSNLGSEKKLLLLVAPQAPITGLIRGRFLRYRGVVMIGATFRPTGGTSYLTPAGTMQPGHDIFQLSFDNQDDWDGESPFIFLANIDFKASATKWGDFLRTGTSRNASNNNFSQWCEIFMQKIRVDVGHYGWTPPDGSTVPHSDFLQVPYGAVSAIHVYDCDINWGYQTFFTRVQAPDPPHPTAVHRFKQVYTRMMEDNTLIYPANTTGRTQYYLNAMGFLDDLQAGRYQCHTLWRWHLEPDPLGHESLLEMFNLKGLTPFFIGNRLTFRQSIPSSRALPLLAGYFTMTPPTVTFAPPSQLGYAKRITTAATLRSITL